MPGRCSDKTGANCHVGDLALRRDCAPRQEISPAIPTKLDYRYRGSVLNVTELLMLAAAQKLTPVVLPFPGHPEENVKCLRGHTAQNKQVVDVPVGRDGLALRPGAENEIGPWNLGIELVKPVERPLGAGTNRPVAQSMSDGVPIRAGVLGDAEQQLVPLVAWINEPRRELENEN